MSRGVGFLYLRGIGQKRREYVVGVFPTLIYFDKSSAY